MAIAKLIAGAFTNSAIVVIGLYRKYISCLMLPRCRFYPSCSAYAQQAIRKMGLMRGLAMALRRLLRCHPFSRSPFHDPVN